MLVRVFNTLAFVRLRQSLFSYLCGKFTNNLLIDTLNNNGVGVGHFNGNSLCGHHFNRMRIAQVHQQVFALQLRSVTNAVNL